MYVRTGEGWLYQCIVKDLYDGSIVGWSTGSTQTVIWSSKQSGWRYRTVL